MKFAVKEVALGNGSGWAAVRQLGSFPSPIETPGPSSHHSQRPPHFHSSGPPPLSPFPSLLPPPIQSPSLVRLLFSSSNCYYFFLGCLEFCTSSVCFLGIFPSFVFFLSLDGISPKTISDIGGIHQLLGLHQHILVALPRDFIISLPEYESSNRTGASFHTPGGRRLIKPAEYLELVSSMKPDLWVTLADEVPAWVSNKRNTISVDRTLRWLDDCISFDKEARGLKNVEGVRKKLQSEMFQGTELVGLGLEKAWMSGQRVLWLL